MGENSGSGFVSADAQFSTVTILRPYPNFEADYQGKSAYTPVALTPDGAARDPSAKDKLPGFDPNLVAGLPVPQGARVQLWLPQCIALNSDDITTVTPYQYFIAWRFRNIRDFVSPADPGRIQPWHFPRQRPGQSDNGSERFVIPAALRSIGFEQSEPAALGNASLYLRPEAVVPLLNEPAILLPLLPGGTKGAIQQGVFDSADFGDDATKIDWQPFTIDAEGDELLIFAIRNTIDDETTPTWDFAPDGADFAFSNIYGTASGEHAPIPEVGIYVQTGTMP